jgi:elongation factor Ts
MTPEDVPAAELEQKKAAYRQQALQEGKPEKIVERIVEGRLKKFYAETCLMEHPRQRTAF